MDGVCGRIRARVRRAWPVVAVIALGVSASACNTTGGASSFGARDTSVAFESIDGPPQAVFRRLVQKLSDEAQARQVPMVTREGFAPYRVRGYLAAGVEKKKKRTLISWVWDVYDAQQSRAFRISGEETVNGASGDVWAAIDDETLSRIARNGMAQLADYLRAQPGAPAVSPSPAPDGDRVATLTSHDDFRPEFFGITRLFGGDKTPEPAAAETAETAETPQPSAVPLPPARAKAPSGRVALAE